MTLNYIFHSPELLVQGTSSVSGSRGLGEKQF